MSLQPTSHNRPADQDTATTYGTLYNKGYSHGKDDACCTWKSSAVALAILGIAVLGISAAVYTGKMNISCELGAMSQMHAQWAMVAGGAVIGLSLITTAIGCACKALRNEPAANILK